MTTFDFLTLREMKAILGVVISVVLISIAYSLTHLFRNHLTLCVMSMAVPLSLFVGFLVAEIFIEDRKYEL